MKIKILTTVYHSLVNWRTGIPYGLPPFCFSMPSCLGFNWFGTVASVDISSCSVKRGYEATLLLVARVLGGKGPSSIKWEYSASR